MPLRQGVVLASFPNLPLIFSIGRSRGDEGMTRQAYGAGSMREREPGVWRLRVMVKGKQVERTFRGTETAARKELRRLTVEDAPAGDGRTFGDLLTKWLAHIAKRGRAPKTIDEARREIENRIRPLLGNIPVSGLTAEQLDDAYDAWLGEGLSESSVHRHAAVISAALTQGFKWGWIDSNPALRSSPPAQPKTKARAASPDQVSNVLHRAQDDDPVMAAAVALAFVTGARRGELCALKWSDVDLIGRTVTIDKALTQVGRKLEVKGTKTGRDKVVTLDDASVAVLRNHRAWQEDLAERAGSPLVADPYVLSDNANGGCPVEPSKITDRFTALRKAAGVRAGITFHSLRHASATEQLAAGISPVDVAARLGHASTRTTLETYAHALPAGDVKAASVMGALLPG